MAIPNSLQEINKLQQQIEQLKDAAVSELKARRAELESELKSVESEIENLTGKPATVRRPRAYAAPSAGPVASAPEASSGKKPDLQELKALLGAAPEKTISLRKEGYDVRNVKILAMANPHLLRMGGKGAWPEVTLLK